ncbi:PREDICTED: retinol dehydrogenase 14-like [Papilio xuthus]|uniref:Retinol dehydrogenase 14-like n=1 Tax=Papilio xuthus TaxID=66420 RepID=A0AAJ6Z9R1_PAPXU|nr:PREDICTED: retinol dehydrogenase 14-like [Papilio xuthus]
MWLLWLLLTLVIIKIFNKLTTGKCSSGNIMTGKVVIVTGASRGLGYETALDLARRGAKVIVACRDDTRGKQAVETIINKTKNKFVRYIKLDLSSLKSVREFVNEFTSKEAKLDVLINNAGAICTKTEDGIMRDMQVNHFGPFLLTILLTPILKKSSPSRVVIVSSALHKLGYVPENWSNTGSYFQAYANSKLCNILFSNELARRLEGSGVVVNSLNPGQVNTSLYRSSTLLEKMRSLVLYTFFKSPEEGAQTSIYLAVADECDDVSGRYYEDCKESCMSHKAKDKDLAAKLWSMSEKFVKLSPEEVI